MPPTECPVADWSVAPLLALDTQKYYGVFCTSKEKVKRLSRTLPVPVVLFLSETTD